MLYGVLTGILSTTESLLYITLQVTSNLSNYVSIAHILRAFMHSNFTLNCDSIKKLVKNYTKEHIPPLCTPSLILLHQYVLQCVMMMKLSL